MLNKFIICIVFAAAIRLHAAHAVVGYYPYWMQEEVPLQAVAMENLTHIVHAFAWPTPQGDLEMPHNFLSADLPSIAHDRGIYALLALGGWGQSDGFAPMAADSLARQRFAENLLQFCLQHDYDGVDIDWEHPANAQDRNNMTKLVRTIRAEFSKPMRPQPLFISMAVTAGDWAGQWLDYDELQNYVDWFGCMSYDFHGPWTNHSGHNSPLYASGGDGCGSVNSGIRYLTQTRGVDADKVLLGVPFYGRGFNCSGLYQPSSGDGGEYRYADIPPLIDSGWVRQWDGVAKVPYLLNRSRTKLISYDDTVSVRTKADYAVSKNLKGVMIWALGQDNIDGDQPLLRAVSIPIRRSMAVKSNLSAQPCDFGLSSCPNPFNNSVAISFRLVRAQAVTLEILDINGRLVKVLHSGRLKSGHHRFIWAAVEQASGVYFCRLRSEQFERTIHITLLR